MADDEEKAKAEKIAAAKKRVEALKKKAKKPAAKKDEATGEPSATASATPSGAADISPEAPVPAGKETEGKQQAAKGSSEAKEEAEKTSADTAPPLISSLSQQSKARSTTFRKGSVSQVTSDEQGETAADIYRRHVARIEELERENKKLVRESTDAEKRWKKAEDELADLREAEAEKEGVDVKETSREEVEKLKNDLAALERKNSQLQAQLSRSSGATVGANRHGPSSSISMSSPPAVAEFEAQLQSRSATIETMELEISRLRAQVERLAVSASTPGEQISALEEKLARAEKTAALAQRELSELKRNLERTAEKAVRAGSERVSAETKLRALEKEMDDIKAEKHGLVNREEVLEKKVAMLSRFHREQDGRTQALRKEKEAADEEVKRLRELLEKAEAEVLRFLKKDAVEGGGDDGSGVDELEDEGRKRLEQRVRTLEAENSDLRRGIWHERRKEMQIGPDGQLADVGPNSAGGRFPDVDLSAAGSPTARRAGGGLGDFFSSGLSALTGTGGAEYDDGLLDDGDMEFDENAFRKAQAEDHLKRLERIKEIKRSLKNWVGWRLDLVENRRGGGEGIGEIFEV